MPARRKCVAHDAAEFAGDKHLHRMPPYLLAARHAASIRRCNARSGGAGRVGPSMPSAISTVGRYRTREAPQSPYLT